MPDPVYLRPAQAARLWPHDGKPPHPSKVLRAILTPKKLKRSPGATVSLRAVHNGQTWLTTAEWIHDYVAALTADRGGTAPIKGITERAERARSRLAASGW
jgi:hypothetical protein